MRAVLANFAFHKAVGLYLGEHEVAVSEVASTLFGTVEVTSRSELCTPENMEEALKRLMEPLLGKKRRLAVAVGLPNARVFFGTRLARTGSEVTAESVLQRALSSPNIRIDDLTVDLVQRNVNKLPVASVAACRKKYMVGLIGLLTQLGMRPSVAEPEACAMVRLAAHQHRFPRRAKLVLCIFLNATHGLAVVVSGGRPLAWKQFVLPAGSEGLTILSAARALQTQHKHYGIESTPDYAMIFGRADLHERLRQEQFPSELGTRVLWHDAPALDGRAAAYGLGLGCLAPNEQEFDLSRHLKPRPSIAEIFPWGELAFAVFLIACMGAILGIHAIGLKDAYTSLRLECGRHKCLSAAKAGCLEKDEQDLKKKVEAARRFLESRILWTLYTRDIAARLPANAQLILFQGENELETRAKQAGVKTKKSLMLRATAPISQDGGAPREIDAFLSELRKNKLLKRDFATVEVADVKRSESRSRAQPSAVFTIMCLPRAKSAGGETAKEAKE